MQPRDNAAALSLERGLCHQGQDNASGENTLNLTIGTCAK